MAGLTTQTPVYLHFQDGSDVVIVSAVNPLPITGSISATNPSVAQTGTADPGYATEIGWVSGGDLVAASVAHPLPVSATVEAGAPYQATPKGYQQITGFSGSAATLTVPSGATFAMIGAEGSDCRWRDDGTAPTSSVGMRMYWGQPPIQFSGDLSALSFLALGSGGVLNVSYYA